MEGLCKELSCPVCLELFTPPVLELPCSHNYCRQCIHETLISQNCTHVNGKFCCPMCRKVICLRGRGITGLKRNIFVENVLEKVKEEMAKIQVREHNVKSQTCRIHEEVMNLMCLDDDIPICSICKLFGDHNMHEVARLSEVYQGRKNSFIEEITRIVLKSETAARVSQELEKLQDQLLSTAEETKAMISAVGDSLLMEIRFKVSSLKMKVDKESTEKCNELQSALEDLQGSRRLYMKMKSLLEEHINPIQFLKEDKQLKIEVAKLFEEDRPLPVPKRDNISVGQYIEELIKGIDIKQVAISKADDLLVKVGDEYAAWSSSCSNVDTSSYDGLDQMIRKMMSSLTLKSSDANNSLSWECPSPYSTSGSSEDSYSPEEVKVITIQKTSL
ncbi:tripartite motif-containing protein 54-like [Huso huso]|uniref:Tripartite motif-containing protein 54-like n=1 Tax=Huso huso TaxID=61971 RepID=A0ABR0Z7F2_HUSHU